LTRMTRPPAGAGGGVGLEFPLNAPPRGGDVWRPLGWAPRVVPDHLRNTPSWGGE